ncbi:MAG TPA: group III truncated hemoglobin, partial [Pseudobdellovibrionaceae bacterium]
MDSQIHFPQETDSVEINSVLFNFRNIKTVIKDFYRKVAMDPVLSVPFQSVEDWPHHVVRLTHFWWIRFGGDSYLNVSYNPPEKHFHAGFNQEFLTRWLGLFQETLQDKLSLEQATLWGVIAERMGVALTFKNDL